MAADFLTYSLRTALCITAFYMFFKLLLSRETFHAFNRRLVLAATVLSFVLPLCVITVHRTMPAPQAAAEAEPYIPQRIATVDASAPRDMVHAGMSAAEMQTPPAAAPTGTAEAAAAPDVSNVSGDSHRSRISDATPPAAETPLTVLPPQTAERAASPVRNIPWRQIALAIYFAGAAAVAGMTLRSIAALRRLTRKGRRERLEDGTTLICMEGDITPISWCRNIVISEHDLRENGEAILAHERAHIRLHHSLDLLLVDLAGAVQWFNPAMWLLRRDLRAIHEYEADAAVIASGVDARSYQLLLIRKAVGGRWYSIANSFNHSKLKNRITMMLREKSSRRTRARALLLLPLAGLALGAFAETVYVHKVTKEFSENQLSETQIASGMESEAGSRIGMPRGAGNDATVVAGDTVRRGEMPKTRNWDSLSEQERERIRNYFESDEWREAQAKLEEMGAYFNGDEWKQKVKELEEYFNSDEWKQAAEELNNMGRYFESEEWKQGVQKLEESGRKLEEYFNSDEWKEFLKNNMTSDTIRLGDGTLVINNNIISDGRPTLGAIRTEDGRIVINGNWADSLSPEERERLKDFFESDEWQKAQAKLKEMGAYFNGDEWQKNSKELKKIGEYFNSDEWREAWKHTGQAASSGDDAYFQSDEWKQIKRKLDEWRAANDESGMPEWVIEARRDMARNRETLRQDMAETERRMMETQRKIAQTQEKIRQSGDSDRSVRREIRKTHREMDKVYKEMARAQEEMNEAQQEIEQAAREIRQANK